MPQLNFRITKARYAVITSNKHSSQTSDKKDFQFNSNVHVKITTFQFTNEFLIRQE